MLIIMRMNKNIFKKIMKIVMITIMNVKMKIMIMKIQNIDLFWINI